MTDDRHERLQDRIRETQELLEGVEQDFQDNMPLAWGRREPRWRYFQRRSGPMFIWTTEQDADGWYWSSVAYPVGPGARSGKAQRWTRTKASARKHRRRKNAKARALKLFRRWDEGVAAP